MVYGEPETAQFLAAVERLKRQLRTKARLTRQAKQRARSNLRKRCSAEQARPSVLEP